MKKDTLLNQRKMTEWENIFATHVTESTLISYFELPQIHSAKTNPVKKKMGKGYEFRLTQEKIQRAGEYMERCPTLQKTVQYKLREHREVISHPPDWQT